MQAFQTISDKGNPEYILKNGPFISTHDSLNDGVGPWIGEGYYFWEHNISLAHWWGKSHILGDYVICSCNLEYDKLQLWDLYNDHDHLAELDRINKYLNDKLEIPYNDLTLVKVIRYMKDNDLFTYSAVRVISIGVINEKKNIGEEVMKRMRFSTNHKSYFDIIPPIQVCLYHRKALNLQAYKIVHPEKYLPSEWLV